MTGKRAASTARYAWATYAALGRENEAGAEIGCHNVGLAHNSGRAGVPG